MCHFETTLAVGEEDSFTSTMAFGEEGCTDHDGEELPGLASTRARGEEGPDLGAAVEAANPFGGF